MAAASAKIITVSILGLLTAGIVTSLVAKNVKLPAAETLVLSDDFDSGQVTWEIVQGTGTVRAEAGRLVLSSDVDEEFMIRPVDRNGTSLVAKNVKLRAVFRIPNNGQFMVGFGVRGRTYFGGIDSDDEIGLFRYSTTKWPREIAGGNVPFRVVGQDIVIQMVADRNTLTYSAWPADQPSNVVKTSATIDQPPVAGEFVLWIRLFNEVEVKGHVEFDDFSVWDLDSDESISRRVVESNEL